MDETDSLDENLPLNVIKNLPLTSQKKKKYKKISTSTHQKENLSNGKYELRVRPRVTFSNDYHYYDQVQKPNCSYLFCKKCKQKFQHKSEFKNHKKAEKFSCEICNSLFCLKFDLIEHIRSNCETDLHCSKCNVYLSKDELIKHKEQPCDLNSECFTCDICQRKYARLQLLILHIDKHNLYPFCCNICKQMFEVEENLEKHKCIKTSLYKCLKCYKKFKNVERFQIHILKHDNIFYKCKCCTKSFSSSDLYNKHSETCLDNNLKCEICNKVFKYKNNFKKHLEAHQIFKCEVCQKEFDYKDNLNEHKCWEVEEKLECEACGRHFIYKRDLSIHFLKDHLDLEYKCKICGDNFTNEVELDGHLKKRQCRETGEFECSECTKKFTKLIYLRKHLFVHQKKSFKCSYCYVYFIKEKNYKNHLLKLNCSLSARRKRLSEYNFLQCRYCEIEYIEEAMLIEHFELEHPTEEPHICFICNEQFKTFENIKNHIHQHNIEKYSCTICHKHYSSQEGFRKHRLKHKKTQLKCQYCNSAFLKENRLNLHVKNCKKNPFNDVFERSLSPNMKIKKDGSPKQSRQLHWKSQIIQKRFRLDPSNSIPDKTEVTDQTHNFFDNNESDSETEQGGWFDNYYSQKENQLDNELDVNDLIKFNNTKKYEEDETREDFDPPNMDDEEDLYVEEESSSSSSSSEEEDIGNEEIDYNYKYCRFCSLDFSHEFDLLHHFIKNHPAEKAHKCPYCELQYPLFAQLREHMKEHGIGLDIFNCTNCSKKFRSEKKIEKHNLKCKGLVEDIEMMGKDFCKRCGKIYHTKCGFKRHKQTCKFRRKKMKIKKKKEAVEEVQNEVVSDDEWREPEEVEENQVEVKVEYIQEEKELENIVNIEPAMDSFSCRLCDKKFQYERGLVMHFKNEHPGKKALVCPICNMELADKMKEHLKTHGIGEEFVCELCGKKFNQKFQSKIHELWHQGIEYKCPTCKQKFLNPEKMEKHINESKCKNRESIMKLPCEICGKSYKSKFGLTKHFMTHTPKDLRPVKVRLNCEFCGKWFENNNGLVRHRRIHTGERPYCCKFCPKAFAQEGNCKAHERIHTGESKPRRKRVICQNGYYQLVPPTYTLMSTNVQGEEFVAQVPGVCLMSLDDRPF